MFTVKAIVVLVGFGTYEKDGKSVGKIAVEQNGDIQQFFGIPVSMMQNLEKFKEYELIMEYKEFSKDGRTNHYLSLVSLSKVK